MASNFPGLTEILPRINVSPLGWLDPAELTKGAIESVFPNAVTGLFETKFWSGLPESYMKTSMSLVAGIKTGSAMPEAREILPGIIDTGRSQGKN